MAEVLYVQTEKIGSDQNDQRMDLDDEDLDDLVASVRRVGILLPLSVVDGGDSFVLLSGHRRLAAARRIGLAKVPVVVFEGEEIQRGEVTFAENFFRKDLSPIERAAAMKDVVASGAVKLSELAKIFHRSGHWVAGQLAMMGWPSEVLEAIHGGAISAAAGANLAAVEDDAYREFLVRQAVAGGATARTTAAWLQAYRAQAPPAAAVEAEPGAGPARPAPMVPQAPCLACGQVYRTDQLSHVPICAGCINAIRNV